MSDIENQSSDTKIHKIKVSEQYKEDSLNQVKAMVRGNQFDPDAVVIESFDGEILHFQAENMLHVYTKVAEKVVPGQVKGAIRVKDDIAAKEEMAKAYALVGNSQDIIRQIRDVIMKRDDIGFALDNEVVPLSVGKKEFVIFDPCLTCKTTGKINCMRCQGQGFSVCPRCSGSGMGHCSHCNGAHMVQGQNGQKIQCPVCHGRGKTMCSQCQQQGRIQCKTCASKGVTTCPNCDGHAWTSRLFIQELMIRTAFDYPKAKLPDKVVALIDKHGAKIREHAEIKVVEDAKSIVNADDEAKQKDLDEAKKRKDVLIPIIYEVVLPYGHVEYGINGKSYYTFLFGTKGRLTHTSPFLDDLIKNGVRKLRDAAEGRGDVAENILQAAEYRTVKEGIYYASRYILGKARNKLKQSNKLGLSDDGIKDIIRTADLALRNITKKPRYIGLGIAAVLHCVLIGGYFMSPARDKLVGFVPNVQMHVGFDALVVLLSVFVGMFVIQGFAQRALGSVMRRIMPDEQGKLVAPKLAEVGLLNAGLAVVVAVGALEYMRRAGISDVSWFNDLMAQIPV
ncbi:MAG: hypothetical protein ACRBDI_05805 [Alphaproteobacteria bacterium]